MIIEWKINPILKSSSILLLTATIQELTTQPNEVAPIMPFSKFELIELFRRAPVGIHCTRGIFFQYFYYFSCLIIYLSLYLLDGRILWANDAILNHLGYKAEEYIGHDVLSVSPNFYLLFHYFY